MPLYLLVLLLSLKCYNLFLRWKACMNKSMNLANIKVYLEFAAPDFIKTLESERLEHYRKFAKLGIEIHPWLLSVSSPSFHTLSVRLLCTEPPEYLSNPYTSMYPHPSLLSKPMPSITTITAIFPGLLILPSLPSVPHSARVTLLRQKRNRETHRYHCVFETATIWKFWSKDVVEGNLNQGRRKT